MSITTKLQMVFLTETGTNHTVTINEPRADLLDADVKLLMENMLTNGAIDTKDGKLASIKSAGLITRTYNEFVVL